jgi:hypothetical protein
MQKVSYTTGNERDALIHQYRQQGKYLILDAILAEEKYLVFDDQPIIQNPAAAQKELEIVQQTNESINAQVVEKIRDRYSINDEFKMQRLGLQDKYNLEYLKYINYVQQCVDWGENEKKKLELGIV